MGVLAGPVQTIGEALSHPQTMARGMVVELNYPQAGATYAVGCPIHFSALSERYSTPAPLLGQRSREDCGSFTWQKRRSTPSWPRV